MYAINDDIKLARTLAHSFTSNHRRIEFNDPMAKLKDLLHSFSTEGEGEREADENGLSPGRPYAVSLRGEEIHDRSFHADMKIGMRRPHNQ